MTAKHLINKWEKEWKKAKLKDITFKNLTSVYGNRANIINEFLTDLEKI